MPFCNCNLIVDYQTLIKSAFRVYKELTSCQQEINSLSTNS